MFQGDCKVIRNEKVTGDTCIMDIAYPQELISDIKPGQFLQIKVRDDESVLFKRPFSISFVNKDENSVRIFYRLVGKNTKALSRLKAEDMVSIISPLGNSFETDISGLHVLVGGGIGVAPLYELAKDLKAKGNEVFSFIGYRTKEEVLYEEELSSFSDSVIVTTDDGSYGEQGFVTAAVRKFILDKNFQGDVIVHSCGPNPMLKALSEAVGDIENVKCFLSLEENMACGIGACIGCVVKTKEGSDDFKYRRVCKEGPVFNAEDILWD